MEEINELDTLTLKLMQAIYAGSQPDSLKFASQLRRLILHMRLTNLNQLTSRSDDQVLETSEILEEISTLSNVFSKGGENNGRN